MLLGHSLVRLHPLLTAARLALARALRCAHSLEIMGKRFMSMKWMRRFQTVSNYCGLGGRSFWQGRIYRTRKSRFNPFRLCQFRLEWTNLRNDAGEDLIERGPLIQLLARHMYIFVTSLKKKTCILVTWVTRYTCLVTPFIWFYYVNTLNQGVFSLPSSSSVQWS